MAGRAIGAKFSGMESRFTMTANASTGGAFEFSGSSVAGCAGHTSVRAGQFECSVIVIEGGWLPARCRMAAFTGSTLGASMHIIFLMATKASHWSAFEDTIDMARCARNSCMFTGQFESRQIVIKGGGFPGCCNMAGAAICTKSTGVSVILKVAGYTIGWGALEYIRGGMALGADSTYMRTSQLESCVIVIER